MRKLRAILAGIVLAALVAGPTLAADAGGTTVVTATVNKSISLSGIEPTCSLGSGVGGTTLTGCAWTAVIASSETTYLLKAKTTNFTKTPDVIGAANVTFVADGVDKAVTAPDTDVTLSNSTPSTAVSMKLAIPGNTKSGAYTATVTWTATN